MTIDLRLGDCLELMRGMPDKSIGAVITDPPYGAQVHQPMCRTRSVFEGRTIKEGMPFLPISDETRTALINESRRLCKGWALVFSQAEALGDYQELCADDWRRSMVWVKPDSAPQFTGDRPAMGYESIACAWFGEGQSKWNGGGKRGVLYCNSTDFKHEHPTQKPLNLIMQIIGLFTNEGDTILDPFMGSGTTGVACVKLNRSFIGMEINEQYFNIAKKRIEDAQKQPALF